MVVFLFASEIDFNQLSARIKNSFGTLSLCVFLSFRLQIIPGSIAEEVGMHIGDVVVRINDIPTNNLSYYDAHQLLACAGNRFVLGILRLVKLDFP